MRNQLSCIIFIRNCNGVFPPKSNICNKISGCNSMHLSCFEFLSLGYIAMKCSFCVASYAKPIIAIVRCWDRIFVFACNFSKLTLFPRIITLLIKREAIDHNLILE